MRIDLTGKTALVTGSTQGIGRAIAATLADAGRPGRRSTGAARIGVAATIDGLRTESADRELVAAAGDVTTATGAAEVLAASGDVDILVNNLGIFGSMAAAGDHRRRVAPLLRRQRARRRPPDPLHLPGMTERGWGACSTSPATPR